LPGKDGFDVAWARNYRSLAGWTDVAESEMGDRWDYSWNIWVYYHADIDLYVMGEGTGRRLAFRKAEEGGTTYYDATRSRSLVPGTPIVIRDLRSEEVWTFVQPSGADYPKLATKADRNGNQIGLSYDQDGLLSSIVDTLGRVIAIGRDSAGRVDSVTLDGTTQVAYTYYDGVAPGGRAGDLRTVLGVETTASPLALEVGEYLDPVIPNDGALEASQAVTYEYYTASDLPAADPRIGLIKKISTEGSGGAEIVELGYDTATQRVLWEVHGDGQIDFTYAGGLSPAILSAHYPEIAAAGIDLSSIDRMVVVNDRVGSVAEQFFDEENRLLHERKYAGYAPDPEAPTSPAHVAPAVNRPGAPLRQGEAAFVTASYVYNELHALKKMIDGNGNVTEYAYPSDIDSGIPVPEHRRNDKRRIVRTPSNRQDPFGVPYANAGLSEQAELKEERSYIDGPSGCCGGGTSLISEVKDPRWFAGPSQIAMQFSYDANGNPTGTTGHIPDIHNGPTSIYDLATNRLSLFTDMENRGPLDAAGTVRADEYVYYDADSDQTAGDWQVGRLYQRIEDVNGQALVTSFEYDLFGNLIKVTDPAGRVTDMEYNEAQQLVAIKEPLVTGQGRRTRLFFYDAAGRVVGEAEQNITESGLTAYPLVYIWTSYSYDHVGNLVEVRRPAGTDPIDFLVTTYQYDADQRQTVELRELEEGVAIRTETQYDGLGRVYRVRRFTGRGTPEVIQTVQFDYDGNGNVIRIISAPDDLAQRRDTTFQYDGYNRRRFMTDPSGTNTEWSYDAAGNVVRMTVRGTLGDGSQPSNPLPILSESTATYDGLNRQLSATHKVFSPLDGQQPGGGTPVATSETLYALNSLPIGQKLNGVLKSDTYYDSMNRVKRIVDAEGNQIEFEYDLTSRVIKVTTTEVSQQGGAPVVTELHREYDDLGRLTREYDGTLPNPISDRHYQYDLRGNLVLQTDSNGKETRHVYDGADRLVATSRDMDGDGASFGDPDDIVIRQEWNRASRLTAQIDGNGNRTEYEYDKTGALIKLTYADGTFTTYSYNIHGDQTGWIDANGHSTLHTLDPTGRVARVDVTGVPSGSNTWEEFRYDGLGRLMRAANADATVLFKYDSRGLLLQESLDLTDDGQSARIVTSAYDLDGSRTSVTYPSGLGLGYTYDQNERPRTIASTLSGATQSSFAFDYIGFGRVQERRGDGQKTVYSFDPIGRLTGVDNRLRAQYLLPATSDKWSLIFDGEGNKTGRTELLRGIVQNFNYDDAYRMVQSTKTKPNVSSPSIVAYALDKVHNRTGVTGGPNPGAYIQSVPLGDKAMNRYTTTPADSRNYDPNGNLESIVPTASGAKTEYLGYDFRNRMTSYRKGEEATSLVVADADGGCIGGCDVIPADPPLLEQTDHTIGSIVYNLGSTDEQLFVFGSNEAGTLPPGGTPWNDQTRTGFRFSYIGKLGVVTAYIDTTAGEYLVQYVYGVGITPSVSGNVVTLPAFPAWQTSNSSYVSVTEDVKAGFESVVSGVDWVALNGLSFLVGETEREVMVDDITLLSPLPEVEATYKYDALGRRIAKTVDTATTTFWYDGWRVIEERNELAALTHRYIHGLYIDEVLEMERPDLGKRYRYQTDDMYNVTALSEVTLSDTKVLPHIIGAGGWNVFDASPATPVASIYSDATRGPVVRLTNTISGSDIGGFAIGDSATWNYVPSESTWNDGLRHKLSFWYRGGWSRMYIGVNTTKGPYLLTVRASSDSSTAYLEGSNQIILNTSGIARSSWTYFERDVSAILEQDDVQDIPGFEGIKWINTTGILIRPDSTLAGNILYIDDVTLFGGGASQQLVERYDYDDFGTPAFQQVAETVLMDGENPIYWQMLDALPVTFSLGYEYDADLQQQVHAFRGSWDATYGTQVYAALGWNVPMPANPADPATPAPRLSFWHKGRFHPVVVQLTTATATRLVYYYTSNGTNYLDGAGNVRIFLGNNAIGGASWKLFDRDIVADWLTFRPNEAVKTLDGFRITPGPLTEVPAYDYDVLLAHVKLSVSKPFTASAAGNRYLWQGREWDAESGLYQYRNRVYAPGTASFTSGDPIGIWGDPVNIGAGYAFALHAGHSRLDPHGLQTPLNPNEPELWEPPSEFSHVGGTLEVPPHTWTASDEMFLWSIGAHAGRHVFFGRHAFTRAIASSSRLTAIRRVINARIRNCDFASTRMSFRYSISGGLAKQAIHYGVDGAKTAFDILTGGALRHSEVTMLGSFDGSYYLNRLSPGIVRVRFHLWNPTTLSSGTRISYSGRVPLWPWLSSNRDGAVGPGLGGTLFGLGVGRHRAWGPVPPPPQLRPPKSIFSDRLTRESFGNISQDFYWEELHATKCPCP